MSVIGRGKGRGFAEVRETTLRRPGQTSSAKFNELINLIDNLAINDASDTISNEIIEAIKDATKNNTLHEIFDDIYKQALEDRQFGIKLTNVFCNDKMRTINENNDLRHIFLNKLQESYAEREDLKQKSVIHFRNAISLLGEVYNKLIINKMPLKFLPLPFLDYMEMLLEASEEEDIELVTIQISINGKKLYVEHNIRETKLQNFLTHVRSILINRNLSARSRGMLLYIIDLANQQFAPLSGQLHEFYISELGINTIIDIQCQDKDFNVNAKSKDNSIDKNNTQSYSRMKNPRKQGKNSGFSQNEKSSTNVSNEKPMPRAIRGTGAADNTKDKNNKRSPRGQKDKLTDEQIWSSKQVTNSKVWGHDDRFDKDYA